MSMNWKEAAIVSAAGGIGGALSLVYSITIGNPPVIAAFPWGIFAYIFLGMGTGYLGVYVLAKTDTTQFAHCLGFAIACGLSWAPIMDATSALVKQNTERQLQGKIEEINKEIDTVLREIPTVEDKNLAEIQGEILRQTNRLTSIAKQAATIGTVSDVNQSLTQVASMVTELEERDPTLARDTSKQVSLAVTSAGEGFPIALTYPGKQTLWFDLLEDSAFGIAVGKLQEKDSEIDVVVIKKHGS